MVHDPVRAGLAHHVVDGPARRSRPRPRRAETLARFQGREVNPRNEEEPGRILHEMRFGEAATLSLGGGTVYYGTADATPLFVMLLGELRRWGLAREAVDELLPHADRAMEWIERYGDRDGDGYVEYQRTSDRGLVNQGWKDSFDGVRFADGRLPHTPIALCEVQGYVYAAYLARAYFAGEQDNKAMEADLRRRAAELKTNFNRDFWLEDKGWLAMGLDRDKQPIDALTSDMGHCLWTGILDAEKAALSPGGCCRGTCSVAGGWRPRRAAGGRITSGDLSRNRARPSRIPDNNTHRFCTQRTLKQTHPKSQVMCRHLQSPSRAPAFNN